MRIRGYALAGGLILAASMASAGSVGAQSLNATASAGSAKASASVGVSGVTGSGFSSRATASARSGINSARADANFSK